MKTILKKLLFRKQYRQKCGFCVILQTNRSYVGKIKTNFTLQRGFRNNGSNNENLQTLLNKILRAFRKTFRSCFKYFSIVRIVRIRNTLCFDCNFNSRFLRGVSKKKKKIATLASLVDRECLACMPSATAPLPIRQPISYASPFRLLTGQFYSC